MKINWRKVLKKSLNILGYSIFLITAVMLLSEVIYRYQWIDFYAAELHGLNNEEDLKPEDERPTILVLGDSFSADKASYVQELRAAFPEHRIINSAVPGTGIKEALVMAPGRIETFKPDILIYQIYLGNDLTDLEPPVNWSTLSFPRNLYWSLSSSLQFLRFMNYRLGGLRRGVYKDIEEETSREEKEIFSVEKYSPRQKLYLKANPFLIEDVATLNGDAGETMELVLEKLTELVELPDSDCQVYVLSMPHCAVVHSIYRERMEQIGGQFNRPEEITSQEIAFNSSLDDFCQNYAQVTFINPLNVLRAAEKDQPGSLFYLHDPHLNRAGQEVVGQHLVGVLQKSEEVSDQ